jgi:hypothetical protein
MQPAPANPEARSPVRLAAQSPLGRVWITAFAGGALYPAFGYTAAPIAAAIGLASFRPAWRRSVLTLLAILICSWNLAPQVMIGVSRQATKRLTLEALGLAVVWMGLLLAWTRWSPRWPARLARHSLLLLHAMAIGLIVGIWVMHGGGVLVSLAAGGLSSMVSEFLWRSSYWIKWRSRQPAKVPVWSNLFAAIPFLGAGGVPFGKNPAYFAKYEALDADRLVSSQLEGIRLLALAQVWRMADAALSGWLWAKPSWLPVWAVPRHPLVPTMETMLHLPALYSLGYRWAALYGELFHAILILAVFSHTIVGIFCLMGFQIPRNMKSPLLAGTILDFWSRYYFYFKELLMDFWFFPVFLRTSRLPVFWRTMLATVAAAFVGNLYYHVVLYWPTMAAGGSAEFLSRIEARVIYCALLAAGLCGSFARSLRRSQAKHRSAAAPSVPRRIFQGLVVSGFFALLHVWNFLGAQISVHDRLRLWEYLLPWR